MTKQLTTQEQEQLALQDAFAEQQFRTGTFAGKGIDQGMDVFDFLKRIQAAKIGEAFGDALTRAGRGVIRRAGKGSAQRIADARGQKQALARGALDRAAQLAVLDPSGAGSVTLARDIGRATQAAGDVSKEQTLEMEAERKQIEAGLETVEKGEQAKRDAKRAASEARFQAAQDSLKNVGELLQGLKVKDLGAKLETDIAKAEAKQGRIAERSLARKERLADADLTDAQRQRIMKRGTRDIARSTEARIGQRQAEIDLANLRSAQAKQIAALAGTTAEPIPIPTMPQSAQPRTIAKPPGMTNAEFQALYGSLFADPLTPNSQ